MILTTALYEKNFRHVLKSDNWFFNFKSDIITKKLFIVNNIFIVKTIYSQALLNKFKKHST